MNALHVRGISKNFDGTPAVQDVSFTLNRGEILGLIGSNGAGKTTTMKIVLNLLAPDRGEVFDGSGQRNSEHWRAKTGWVPQEMAFYPELSVRENLSFFGQLYALSGEPLQCRILEILQLFGLTGFGDQPAGTLSGGFQRRLNLALGVVHRPEILILDEPTVGIDPESRGLILDYLVSLSRNGCGVLLSSHYAEEIWPICDRVAVMSRGRLSFCKATADLQLGVPSEIRILVGPGSAVPWQRLAAMPGLTLTETGTGGELRIRGDAGLETSSWLETLSTALLELRRSGATVGSFRANQAEFERLVSSGGDVKDTTDNSSDSPADVRAVSSGRGRLLRWRIWGTLASVAGALLFLSLSLEIQPRPHSKGVSNEGSQVSVASPDGRFLLFKKANSLWVHSAGDNSIIELEGTSGANEVFFWSPDGQQLAFIKDGALFRTLLDGGECALVCPLPTADVNAGNWGPDGNILLISKDGAVYQVPSSGGTPQLFSGR